ncbi:MAG TPA: ATP synthase F1 subunit delta [Polyangiales bacterium]
MTIGIIPRRYGSAILALATQENKVDRVSSDLHDFAASWKDSRALRAAFENPVISVEARRKILRAVAAASGMDDLTVRSLLMLSDRGRLTELPQIVEAFDELAEARGGRVRAEVITASELPEAYFSELQKILEQVTGKHVIVTTRVDPSLLGGVVTRIGDQVFDGSLSHKLSELKNQLSH